VQSAAGAAAIPVEGVHGDATADGADQGGCWNDGASAPHTTVQGRGHSCTMTMNTPAPEKDMVQDQADIQCPRFRNDCETARGVLGCPLVEGEGGQIRLAGLARCRVG